MGALPPTESCGQVLRNIQIGIQISDDIDGEAILGGNRRKQKQARANRR